MSEVPSRPDKFLLLMKTHPTPRLVIIAFAAMFSLTFSSCLQDKCEAVQTYTEFIPVWMQPEELRTITLEEPQPMATSGKIYTYLNYLFVNEPHLGIHLYDNTNPANPVPLKFLSIPGNVDLAVRNHMLYADNGPDLLTFSLADPGNPDLIHREEGVFQNQFQDTELGFLLYYESTQTSVEIPCETPGWTDDWVFFQGGTFLRGEVSAVPNAVPAQQIGTGGSLARFTIMDSWLYTVDESSLQVFSLADPASPSSQGMVHLNWGIETIFPYGEHLFLGANDGMYILDATDRAEPSLRSVFQHARACDPVFISGNRAYVTLRDGTECQNFINQLDVVDITDLDNPRLLRSFQMHHPIGLSIAEEWLYLCEDDQGLKIFDRSSLAAIGNGPVNQLGGLSAIDIITLPQRDLAIVIGTDGLHQYDISDRSQPQFLSLIPTQNP